MADNVSKWFCENCGTENDENYCIKCGFSNPNFKVEKNSVKGVQDTKQWQYSLCGRKNSGDFCEECGNPKEDKGALANLTSTKPTILKQETPVHSDTILPLPTTRLLALLSLKSQQL